jgi:peroxiredoxin Q/BCP
MFRIGGAVLGIFAMLGLGGAEPDLKEGMPAPEFSAPDQAGRTVQLRDFRDRSAVVLYFYPKDDTPGCTKEACSLRDGSADLKAAGAVVLGVSADDVASHQAFASKFSLPFSLLADPERKIIDAYGVRMPVLGIAKRVTFLIDKKGIVRRVFTEVQTSTHDRQVLEALKGLK